MIGQNRGRQVSIFWPHQCKYVSSLTSKSPMKVKHGYDNITVTHVDNGSKIATRES